MLTTWHPYPQKLAITSPTSGGRPVGVVRSRTQTMEFVCLFVAAFPQAHHPSKEAYQLSVRFYNFIISNGCALSRELGPSRWGKKKKSTIQNPLFYFYIILFLSDLFIIK
jgi:hypothetical protein